MSTKKRDFKQEMLAELESNDMYRSAMEGAPEADRAAVKRAVEAFIGRFAEGFIEPLAKSVESPELKKALADKLRGIVEIPSGKQQAKAGEDAQAGPDKKGS